MINIRKRLAEKKISVRQMSEITSIPYSTLSDIVNNKVKLEDCRYKTLKKIADFLSISVDDLIEDTSDFQTFRNNLHHKVATMSPEDVLLEIYENREIDYYLLHDNNIRALYLLALADYLSKQNDLPLNSKYSELRNTRLKEPFYIGSHANPCCECIEEFIRYNIYEGDIYDAV